MASPAAKTVSTKLQRIAELARIHSGAALRSLSHHIDLEFLREAYRRVRKDAAPGIDGMTADEYGRNLDERLRDLLERFKSGAYRAPPVKRVYIPKGDGKQRPLGLPTFEDKVLQRAVKMVLEAVYEQDFLDCSWGYRPNRSARAALHVLREGLFEMRGGWVLEVDIQAFFDHLDHKKLREMLDQRVCDGVLRRTIHKWLKAGIFEDGEVRRSEEGSPQGGVISPLLANIYLHEVVDTWFHQEILPRLDGQGLLVRFADDMVMVFTSERDARRVFEVLPKRLARYGLSLHPDKTKLVPFRRPLPSSPGKGQDGSGQRPGTFDFLGFNHHWGRSRRRKWVVRQTTMASRVHRTLRAIFQYCKKHRHRRISEQHASLCQKLQGHYAYYVNPGNWNALTRVGRQTERIWRNWLCRRSQRSRLSWAVFKKLLQHYPLPKPTARPVA